MSFDIAVWSSSKRVTVKQARKIFAKLCEDGDDSAITPHVDAPTRVAAFLDDLTKKYPAIGSDFYDDRNIDDCPWSCDFDQSDVYVVMSTVWSRADEMGSHVESLASKHELVCYDPTSDAVRLSPSLGGSSKPLGRKENDARSSDANGLGARPKGRTAAQAIEELMDQAICSLGFRKQERRLYTREAGHETLGVIEWFDQALTGGTKLNFGIQHHTLEATLSELRGVKPNGRTSSSVFGNIHALMDNSQRDWEYQGPWAARIEQILEDVASYAVPFMETHVTLQSLLAAADRPYVSWSEPTYRKPLAFYLAGESAKTKQLVEEGLSAISKGDAPEYRQFAARLLQRMGETDRAGELLNSIQGLGLLPDANGNLVIRHRETGEVLVRLKTDRPEKLNLQGADLRYADLSGTNLYRANLRRAKLNHACLDGAELFETDLRDADLSSASLRQAKISLPAPNADRVILAGADLREAHIESSGLKGAILVGADLRGARLVGVGLMKADLRDADLRDARIVDSILWEANLTGAKLEGVFLGMERLYPSAYDRKTRWPEGFNPEAHGAAKD